jgi:hypothetical protein
VEKFFNMSKVPTCIRRNGGSMLGDSSRFERSNVEVKQAWERSNRKDGRFEEQVVRMMGAAEAASEAQNRIEPGGGDRDMALGTSASQQCIMANAPFMNTGRTGGEALDPAAFRPGADQHGQGTMPVAYSEQMYDRLCDFLESEPVAVRTRAVAAYPSADGDPFTVKAGAFVAIKADDGETWYGEVLMFLTCRLQVGGDIHRIAYVHWFEAPARHPKPGLAGIPGFGMPLQRARADVDVRKVGGRTVRRKGGCWASAIDFASILGPAAIFPAFLGQATGALPDAWSEERFFVSPFTTPDYSAKLAEP